MQARNTEGVARLSVVLIFAKGGEMSDMKRAEFVERIRTAINCLSMENGSNTPDFLLAEYLCGCLETFDRAVVMRDKWYGRGGDSKTPASSMDYGGGPFDENGIEGPNSPSETETEYECIGCGEPVKTELTYCEVCTVKHIAIADQIESSDPARVHPSVQRDGSATTDVMGTAPTSGPDATLLQGTTSKTKGDVDGTV